MQGTGCDSPAWRLEFPPLRKPVMSLDRSLKTGGGLVRHRNVLNRSERLARLIKEGRMSDENARVIGMPKVANRKVAVGKKAGKKAEGEGAAEGAAVAAGAAAAPAPAAKGAAPATKGAAPASAAKGAAPAAKAAPSPGKKK